MRMSAMESASLRSGPASPVAACPVCGGSAWTCAPLDGWGWLRRCRDCHLGFADPLALPATPRELFEEAYTGKRTDAAMEMFAQRLQWRQDLALTGLSGLGLAPVHDRALKWISRHVPRGAAICDVGCSTGLFMDQLRRSGYRTWGIEPSATAADVARSRGHPVVTAALEELEAAPPAAAVVSFFALHHSPDPLRFIRQLRRLFPGRPVILAEHDFSRLPRRPGPTDSPPRRLTWWTSDALGRLLTLGGYQPLLIDTVAAHPYHHGIEGRLASTYARLGQAVPLQARAIALALYLAAKSLISPVLRHVPMASTGARSHLLAIGAPEEGPPSAPCDGHDIALDTRP